MLIDWLTLRLGREDLGPDLWRVISRKTERLMKITHFEADDGSDEDSEGMGEEVLLIDPITGQVKRRARIQWETDSWVSMRSDTHSVAFRITPDAVHLQGSPGRVIDHGCTVFPPPPVSTLDLKGCAEAMRFKFWRAFEVITPEPIEKWICTRIDVTENLALDSGLQVREALRYLRNCEGGRYRVSQQAGDTVYWNHGSRLRSGKGYHKGPHLRYLMQRKDYNGVRYSDTMLKRADRLLRLELTIRSQWLRERAGKEWHQITAEELGEQWHSYFDRMLGDVSVKDDHEVRARLEELADSPGQARQAWLLWATIQAEGWEKARGYYLDKREKPNRTWYRYTGLLKAAGLSDIDISAGNIVPLRRRILEARPVQSWVDLLNVA